MCTLRSHRRPPQSLGGPGHAPSLHPSPLCPELPLCPGGFCLAAVLPSLLFQAPPAEHVQRSAPSPLRGPLPPASLAICPRVLPQLTKNAVALVGWMSLVNQACSPLHQHGEHLPTEGNAPPPPHPLLCYEDGKALHAFTQLLVPAACSKRRLQVGKGRTR